MGFEITHRNLCLKGANFLRYKSIHPNKKCPYVVCELERIGERPDVFGWRDRMTILIEVKVSRADFFADKKKHWRRHPEYGLGILRCYLCPEGLIKENELPENWGLLYADEKGKIRVVVEPQPQESCHNAEMSLVTSILRREGIKPQVFNYKQYKSEGNVSCRSGINPLQPIKSTDVSIFYFLGRK